ncbi:hypothetical protein EB118_20245 [bacterium]|nr:hypothetical protein [bacterium]NDC96190.1 hypothetical protein [bacterium]NDD85681.1 hypothetical protein [bacterium]NDG32392.1 hypothetical protein [bacterium]
MKNLIAALYHAKKEFPTIKKDMNNPFFKKKYADINSILEQVEPILRAHGVLILQPIDENSVCTQLIHVESGEMMTSCIALTNGVKAQDLGSEITYFRRYSLQSLLALQAEDDDGNLASGRATPPQATQQAPQQAPQVQVVNESSPKATPSQVGEMNALWNIVKEKSSSSLMPIVKKFGLSPTHKLNDLTFTEAVDCINILDAIVSKIK